MSDIQEEQKRLYKRAEKIDKEQEIINNINYFISKFPIIGGYGFTYKQALRILLQGGNYEEVCKWYINQVKGSDKE